MKEKRNLTGIFIEIKLILCIDLGKQIQARFLSQSLKHLS